MMNENQESKRHNNILDVLVGMLIGGLAGAVTMLLVAPQSGKETRAQIQKMGIELRDQTTKLVEDTLAGGREKAKELSQRGQDMVVVQLDHVSEAALAGKKAIRNS